MEVHTGKCLCGEITLQLMGEPAAQGNCYFTDCKKNNGAVFATILFSKMNR